MKVITRPSFDRDLDKLPDNEDKILEALFDLRELSSLSESKHLKKVTGTKNFFRLRIGDYRVLLKWDKETQTLIAETVRHRKDIYKKR
jgi:mRNA interferase RelE/StbE